MVVELVMSERKLQPKIGARKLMRILGEELQGLSIGRDRLLGILRERDMLIKRSHYRPKTTNSYHRFRIYENELKKEEITRIYQALVADITYIKVSESWYYLALITEVYSRLIIGYDLSNSLSIEGSIRAMKMVNKAIKSTQGNCRGTIHHSDRGIQYCSTEYVNLLLEEGMRISMSEKGNPYENAIAERVNGILKEEYLLSTRYPSKEDAINSVRIGIWLYNNKRPHMSLGYKTPMEVYRSEIEKRWPDKAPGRYSTPFRYAPLRAIPPG